MSVSNLESLNCFEFITSNIDHFHRQSCYSFHWVDRFNYNASSEECPKFSSSLIYQQCYPLNACVHESFDCYLNYEFTSQVNLNWCWFDQIINWSKPFFSHHFLYFDWFQHFGSIVAGDKFLDRFSSCRKLLCHVELTSFGLWPIASMAIDYTSTWYSSSSDSIHCTNGYLFLSR